MLSRLAEQFKGLPVLEAFLVAIGDQLNDVEEFFQQLIDNVTLQGSVGAQLDKMGVILAQGRNGLGDDDYRTILQARIIEYQSNGTTEDIIQILLTLGGAAEVQVTESFPAAFQAVSVGANPPVSDADVHTAVLQTKFAGVGVNLLQADDPVFALDAVGPNQAGWDLGHFAGPL